MLGASEGSDFCRRPGSSPRLVGTLGLPAVEPQHLDPTLELLIEGSTLSGG